MDEKFIIEKKFEAFADAIKRYRWFVLINILLSCAAIANVYIENGFTEAQIRRIVARQLLGPKSPSEEKMKAHATKLSEMKAGEMNTPESVKLIDEAVELKLRLMRGDEISKALAMPHRKIPLLEIEVPWNDYIVVLAIMITVFVIATWLSCVNVRDQVQNLHSLFAVNPDLKTLVKFNFFFTSPDDAGLARAIVHRLAILLPVLVFLLAGTVDLWPVLRHIPEGGLQPLYLYRLCFYFGCLIVMVPFCVETLKCSTTINRLTK